MVDNRQKIDGDVVETAKRLDNQSKTANIPSEIVTTTKINCGAIESPSSTHPPPRQFIFLSSFSPSSPSHTQILLLHRPSHRQSLKDRGGLEEGKPTVSDRQKDHENNLHGSHKLAGKDARVGDVLANERDRAHQKANEIGLDKGPLDHPIVDLAGPVDDDSLGQNQGAGRLDQRSQNIEFPFVFPQKHHSKGPWKKEAGDPDDDRGQRVDHEQGVEALAGREIKLEVSHIGGWWSLLRCVVCRLVLVLIIHFLLCPIW